MKKRIIMYMTTETDDDDELIINDIEMEINCCYYCFENVNIYIVEDEADETN